MPSIAKQAVEYVIEYEEKLGRNVVDVQSNRNFRGFDLFSLSKKDKTDIKTIEVKGTNSSAGIPDCFETEFTRSKRLIATHMYVVSFSNPKKIVLYIIPASAFKPEYLSEVIHYKICRELTNKLEQFKA